MNWAMLTAIGQLATVVIVERIIARRQKPTAYSTYDLNQVVLPKDSQ